MHAFLHPPRPMLGPHPIRRLAAFSLLASVLFAAYVAYLWHDPDEDLRTWNWEKSNATVMGRALGKKIETSEQAHAWEIELDRDRAREDAALKLLDHPDPAVRATAARVLPHILPGRPETLPVLIGAHQRGVPVLPAIATIISADATKYLATTLGESGDWDSVTRKLQDTGYYTIAHFAAVYRERQPVPLQLHRIVCTVASMQGDRSLDSRDRPKPDAWITVAADPTCSAANRAAALEVLALLDDHALGTLPALRALTADPSPLVAATARETITRLEGGGTLARLKPRLAAELGFGHASYKTIEKIGDLEAAGRDAGPLLASALSLKDGGDPSAAIALGKIGYTEATPQLIAALENKHDWILAGVAAEALGRLDAEAALPALERIAKEHWNPPVRAMAAESIQVISGHASFRADEESKTNPRYLFGPAFDLHVFSPTKQDNGPSKPVVMARRLFCLIGNTWDRAWLWRARRVAKSADEWLPRPDYGQGFGAGYLLGYNYGNWGGEIVYVERGRILQRFDVWNMQGFYPMPFGLAVVTGDFGTIYLLKPDDHGALTCEELLRLPFQPYGRRHFAPITRRWNRELLIVGYGTQAVVLTRSGNLRMAD